MEKKDQRHEALLRSPKNGYDTLNAEETKKMDELCEDYRTFLDDSMTEREAVKATIAIAEKHGFKLFVPGESYQAGDKIYADNRGKAMILAIIGKQSMETGFNLIAAHIDTPRLDLKPNPLYEADGLAYFKTHYYGGIKKYQWTALPLALMGVVYDRQGKQIDIKIGFDAVDPVLYITDLLPHLAKDQMKKSMTEGIAGEELNALIASKPDSEEGKDRVKLAVMELLNQKYGITECDFQTAELSLVPALSARYVGLDSSMIGAYGHDDRVCSYAALQALLDLQEVPEKTALVLLADKEEIGSEGVTGMKSAHFDWFVNGLCKPNNISLFDCYANSFCVSADVSNAYDPTFAGVSEKNNSAMLNHGIAVCKYTGRGGKGGASDASAEVMSKLRGMFDKANVLWQMAELGKVDQGGGGTVAAYLAERNIDIVDAGVPVLSMHAPFELVGKLDVFMAYKAYGAVLAS
ncbi:MAG: aminopeptidase [Oscillospiraceae bacterium]|nr:aminopeptidase [Oscillospiraceae bacterium]